MRVIFVYILFLLTTTSLFAQDYLARAKEIRDVKQAALFADSLPQVVLGFMHDDMNNDDYQSRKENLKPGDAFKSGSYQVINIAEGTKDIYRFRLLTLTEQRFPDAENQVEKLLQEINNGASYEDTFEEYAENNGPDAQAFGDVGWVDLDYFVESFKTTVEKRNKGDRFIAGDTGSGWFNIVEMTHKPKKKKGHFVLLIPDANPDPFFQNINHQKNIAKLSGKQELRRYAQKHPGDVTVQLLNEASNQELFDAFVEQSVMVSKEEAGVITKDRTSYCFVADTSVELFSIQYIYLNGSEMSRETRSEAIHDIYDQYYANVPFDSIVEQYWPDNKGLSQLHNIEGALLADDLVEKVRATTVGQLFVARVGQSYFLGVPLEKPKKVKAILVLSYPYQTEE
jgi:hypothetical protein